MEVFKPIPGHPDYEVSDHGTVRSLDRTQTLKGKGGGTYTRFRRGTVLAFRRHTQGYRSVSLGSSKQATVHSLVMLAFVGPRPEGAWINHKNGDKTDNRLENLEYCTPKQNQEHAVHTGLADRPPGGNKLTADDVLAIDARLKQGERTVDIAADYGVARGMISSIRSGRAWQWLTGNNVAPRQRVITEEMKAKVKALLSEGRTGREVAALLGITPSAVSQIKNNRGSYSG